MSEEHKHVWDHRKDCQPSCGCGVTVGEVLAAAEARVKELERRLESAEWDTVAEEATTAGVEEYAARLKDALEKNIDPDPCRYDHHGNCQAHALENPCSVAKAKELLALDVPRAVRIAQAEKRVVERSRAHREDPNPVTADEWLEALEDLDQIEEQEAQDEQA